jgi:hypothetical protein
MNLSESGISNGNPDLKPTTPQDPKSAAPDPSSSSSDPRPKGKAQVDAVTALLRGEIPAIEDAPEGDDREPIRDQSRDGGETVADPETIEPAKRGKLSPAEIAKSLGVEPDAVYNMEIPLRDGESVKLGKLKDFWQERETVEREIAEKSTDLDRREAGIIADQQSWAILAANGGLNENALNEARQIVGKQIEREQSLLFDLMPDLHDATKLDLFRRDLVRVMGKVGYKPHEIVLGDHRQGLLLREFISMEKELDALRKATRREPPKSMSPNGRGAKIARKTETPHGYDAKTAAVKNLIGKRT